MFGKKITEYFQRKKQVREMVQNLAGYLFQPQLPHIYTFCKTLEPTLRELEENRYFTSPFTYTAPTEWLEYLNEGIHACGIGVALKLTEAETARIVRIISYGRVLRKLIEDVLPRNFGGIPLRSRYDGRIAYIYFSDPTKLYANYVLKVAQIIVTDLEKASQRKKAALNKKYALEKSSRNKEPLKRVGKLSTHTSLRG